MVLPLKKYVIFIDTKAGRGGSAAPRPINTWGINRGRRLRARGVAQGGAGRERGAPQGRWGSGMTRVDDPTSRGGGRYPGIAPFVTPRLYVPRGPYGAGGCPPSTGAPGIGLHHVPGRGVFLPVVSRVGLYHGLVSGGGVPAPWSPPTSAAPYDAWGGWSGTWSLPCWTGLCAWQGVCMGGVVPGVGAVPCDWLGGLLPGVPRVGPHHVLGSGGRGPCYLG